MPAGLCALQEEPGPRGVLSAGGAPHALAGRPALRVTPHSSPRPPSPRAAVAPGQAPGAAGARVRHAPLRPAQPPIVREVTPGQVGSGFLSAAAGRCSCIGHNPRPFQRDLPGPTRFEDCLFSIIQAAGWPIWPLILMSIVALALITGEEKVGGHLENARPRGIEVLHDRRIPGSRANIDHLVIAGPRNHGPSQQGAHRGADRREWKW